MEKVNQENVSKVCEHLSFQSNVSVFRLTEDDEITVKGYSADIKIRCLDCGQQFEFIGVEPGLSPFHPTINIDSTELRVPIKVSTGLLAFESVSKHN